jgi:hypothetical protein
MICISMGKSSRVRTEGSNVCIGAVRLKSKDTEQTATLQHASSQSESNIPRTRTVLSLTRGFLTVLWKWGQSFVNAAGVHLYLTRTLSHSFFSSLIRWLVRKRSWPFGKYCWSNMRISSGLESNLCCHIHTSEFEWVWNENESESEFEWVWVYINVRKRICC